MLGVSVVGFTDGLPDGLCVGVDDGFRVGDTLGSFDGDRDGVEEVGRLVGL